MPAIDPDRFSERVQTDGEDVVVLDGRHQAAVDDWHTPDSGNIDVYDELTDEPHAAKGTGGAQLAERHGVPYYLHPKDALALDATPIEDGQTVTVGELEIEVVHTPGHSEGSVSFEVDGAALITGDRLFDESVGRVELGVEAGIEDSDVEANAATLYESLQRLLDRSEDAVVLPAHDSGAPEPPVTATLAELSERNAELRRDRAAFVETLAADVPDHPPNFERVKRTNVGQESVPDDELAELELGPNNCATG
ncbi:MULTISPECIES: MBL fold metallo-hydrolase [Haloarcula]|uniref:MBL fold metallo-hydrolase n=1 Tax=Haloarcula TaxID=2237 RepID=UPI0023EDB115|nr:MBL fold metallo-hydrolase [Halomicroarcula sp. XH51]